MGATFSDTSKFLKICAKRNHVIASHFLDALSTVHAKGIAHMISQSMGAYESTANLPTATPHTKSPSKSPVPSKSPSKSPVLSKSLSQSPVSPSYSPASPPSPSKRKSGSQKLLASHFDTFRSQNSPQPSSPPAAVSTENFAMNGQSPSSPPTLPSPAHDDGSHSWYISDTHSFTKLQGWQIHSLPIGHLVRARSLEGPVWMHGRVIYRNDTKVGIRWLNCAGPMGVIEDFFTEQTMDELRDQSVELIEELPYAFYTR